MKKRFEEDVISPAIKEYLEDKGYKVFLEPRIKLENWPLVTKNKRFIRFDLIANKNLETLLIETKSASYPQLIGISIGEINLYKHLLEGNRDNVKCKDEPVPINNVVRLFCAFPDMSEIDAQMSWGTTATELFKHLTSQADNKIGLILAKLKSGVKLVYADITKDDINIFPDKTIQL